MAREFWKKSTSPAQIGRLRKTITIPAFSAPCGVIGCLKSTFTNAGGVGDAPRISAANDGVIAGNNEFTLECWVKIMTSSGFGITKGIINPLFDLRQSVFGDGLGYPGQLVALVYNSAGTSYLLQSSGLMDPYSWNHIALVYSKSALLAKLYLNGSLVASIAIANLGMRAHDATGLTYSPLAGSGQLLDELRVWNVARTQDQILNNMFAPRGAVDSGNGLVAYWNFSGAASATTSVDLINALVLNLASSGSQSSRLVNQTTVDDCPLRYGASFIAAQFPITFSTILNNVSIHPIVKPSGVNFQLAVSWFDDDGNFQRKYLWSAPTGVDIAPVLEEYTGQKLPSSGFILECWNIDGNATIDLETALVLNMSFTTGATSSSDTTQLSFGTGVEDSSLAANFPIAFPATFNTQQTY